MRRRRGLALAQDLLAIDVGNSKAQALLWRDGVERCRWRLPHAPASAAWEGALARALSLVTQDGEEPVSTLLCSVAPTRAAVIERLLRRSRAARLHRLSWRDPWPFRLALRQPETVGADRLANVAGLVALGCDAAIAIDAGTAVTIDVLQQGRFLGGLILPGAELASRALQLHTALLPRVDWRGPAALVGDDTETALRAGIVHGARHAVAGLVQSLRTRFGSDMPAIVTGGQSADLAAALPLLRWEPDLTFLGMRLLATRIRGPRRGARARRPSRPGRNR